MKFYISASFTHAALVEKIQQLLVANGHTIAEDWTKHEVVRPYDTDIRLSMRNALADMKGVESADVLVHLSDGTSSGKHGELLSAVAFRQLTGKPSTIYVIGAQANESQFYFHPAIQRIRTSDVIETLQRVYKLR